MGMSIQGNGKRLLESDGCSYTYQQWEISYMTLNSNWRSGFTDVKVSSRYDAGSCVALRHAALPALVDAGIELESILEFC